MSDKVRKTYSELSAEISPEEMQPINAMITAGLKLHNGRPQLYPNNEEGLQNFIENTLSYFDYVSQANTKIGDPKKQLILDVDSWAVHLGMTRKTICEYQKRNKVWNDVIDYYKNAICASKKQLCLHGAIPTVMAIFDLSNNHNYINASEFKLTTEEATQVDKKDLESQLSDAGLVWDPELKEFVPINQETQEGE